MGEDDDDDDDDDRRRLSLENSNNKRNQEDDDDDDDDDERALGEGEDDDDDEDDDRRRLSVPDTKKTEKKKATKLNANRGKIEKQPCDKNKKINCEKSNKSRRANYTSSYYNTPTPSYTHKKTEPKAAATKVVKKNKHSLKDPGSDKNYQKMRSSLDNPKDDKRRRLNYHDFLYRQFPTKGAHKSESRYKHKKIHKSKHNNK